MNDLTQACSFRVPAPVKRRMSGSCFLAVFCNLSFFVLSFSLCARLSADAAAALVLGGGLTVVGIALSLLGHGTFSDHPFPWLSGLCVLGAAKGCCAAALFTGLEMVPLGDWSVFPLLCLSAGAAMAVSAVLNGITVLFPSLEVLPDVLLIVVPILLTIAAIVLLASTHRLLFGILLINLLTLTFCSVARVMAADEVPEMRFQLALASMLYALFLFLAALTVVSEGECCDLSGCDCGTCDCDGVGKKKKR